MEVIGTVGAVLGIVDILGRSILRLRALQRKITDAPFTLTRLFGELTAAKIALNQLQGALKRVDQTKVHEDILVDLDSSLSSCRLLVYWVDSKLSTVEDVNASDLAVKVRVVLADEETTKCLDCLSRTLLALNIVRENLQSNGFYGQNQTFCNSTNRQIFDQVRDDSTSMIVLWDSKSFRISLQTASSNSTSRTSLRFPGLDEELLQHQVYQQTFRSLIHRWKRGVVSPWTNFSRKIVVSSRNDVRRRKPKPKPSILIGGDSTLSYLFPIYAALNSGGASAELERMRIRSLIVWQVLQAISAYLAKIEILSHVDDHTKQDVFKVKRFISLVREHLRMRTTVTQGAPPDISIELSNSVLDMLTILDDDCVGTPVLIRRTEEVAKFSTSSHLLQRLAAALASDYCPSDGDVFYRSLATASSIASAKISLGNTKGEEQILTWPCSEAARASYISELNEIKFGVFIIDLRRVESFFETAPAQEGDDLSDIFDDIEHFVTSIIPLWPEITIILHARNLERIHVPPQWLEFISCLIEERVTAYVRDYHLHVLDITDTTTTIERIRASVGTDSPLKLTTREMRV